MNQEELELTILMPCLNEEKTLEYCIKEAKQFINRTNISAEILIADNGSIDDSVAIAKKNNARVITIDKKGYGNTLISGINSAKGKYIIMGDSDMSYDFNNLEKFLEKLRAGYDLVMGNRYKGGIQKGAMKLSHKYIGVPILSFLGRLASGAKINDFHCGLRGFNTKTAQELNFQSEGMEFATEMIFKFAKFKKKIIEIPTILRKDGRDKIAHLRTISDGIRHINCISKMYYKYNKKRLYGILGFFILFLIFATIISYKYEASGQGYTDLVSEFKRPSSKYGKTIITKDLNIKDIRVKFNFIDLYAEIAQENKYTIILTDLNNNIIKQEEVDYLEITNSAYTLKLDEPLTEDKYVINVQVNGENQLVLNVAFQYKDTGKYFTLYLATVLLAMLSILAINYLLKKEIIDIPKAYFIIACVIYLLYGMIIPFAEPNDELCHWHKIYQISQGELVPQVTDGLPGTMVTEDVMLRSPSEKDIRYSDFQTLFQKKITNTASYYLNTFTIAVYSPVGYIPQVLGTHFARLFTDNLAAVIYMARLFNIIFSLVILSITLKFLPYGKNIFILLLFSPEAISTFASLSCDAMTTSIIFLFIAYILRILHDKKPLTMKNIAIIGILGFIIALCKLVYFPIFLLILILPLSKILKNKKHAILLGIITILVFIISISWIKLATPALNAVTNKWTLAENVTVYKYDFQTNYMFNNPLECIKLGLNTLDKNMSLYLSEIAGNHLWFAQEINKTFLIPFIFWGVMIFILFADKDLSARFNKKQNIITLLIFSATSILIFVSLFIQYTPVYSISIDGIQGRYFIPLLPLLMLVLGGIKNKLTIKNEFTITKVVFISAIIISYVSLLNIFTYYL